MNNRPNLAYSVELKRPGSAANTQTGPNQPIEMSEWRAAMQSTEWRPIAGYEDCYEVSNTGRVRNIRTGYEPKQAELAPPRGKALTIELSRGGQQVRRAVHRLVADAFLGERTGDVIRHIDGDHTNNDVTNLTWGTQSENIHDSVRHGTHRNSRKTHCSRGHELTGDNLLADKLGRRQCRPCKQITFVAAFAALQAGEGEHGTRRAYTVGCRCDDCRKASSERWKLRQAKKESA